MKRLAIIAVMVLMGLTASASSIHYFTHSQAVRTVEHLGRQNEMMIYCGYDYEIETYVLINEVWMERVNSSYYEIWVYGYDAYTGDEIYMPLDLQCVAVQRGTDVQCGPVPAVPRHGACANDKVVCAALQPLHAGGAPDGLCAQLPLRHTPSRLDAAGTAGARLWPGPSAPAASLLYAHAAESGTCPDHAVDARQRPSQGERSPFA